MFTLLRLVQLLNVEAGSVTIALFTYASCNEVQFWKTYSPIEVTVTGRIIFFSLVQEENALKPMLLIVFGKETD